jgi:hypothetical protein
LDKREREQNDQQQISPIPQHKDHFAQGNRAIAGAGVEFRELDGKFARRKKLRAGAGNRHVPRLLP